MNKFTNSKLYLLIFITLCLCGTYLSWETVLVHIEAHLGIDSVGGVCNISKEMNCKDVAKSSWSEIWGVPLGVYGIVFYLSLISFFIHGIFTKFWSTHRIYTLFAPVLFLAVLGSIFLFCISKFVIKVLCPLCLLIYGVNILLFLLAFFYVYQNKVQRGVFGAIFHEIRTAGQEFLQAIRNFKIGTLVEYLLSICLVALIILGAMVAVRFAEDRYVSQVREWPLNNKLNIKLNFKSDENGAVDYFWGDPKAPIQIIEFADFQCPFCQSLGSQLKSWLKEYEDHYYLVFLNYPLDHSCNPNLKSPFHLMACYLAELSRCAGEQGKFWEAFYYLSRLDTRTMVGPIAEQKDTIRTDLVSFAELRPELVNDCVDSGRQIAHIQNDIARGLSVGVRSTPTIFINGKKVENITRKRLQNIMSKLIQ